MCIIKSVSILVLLILVGFVVCVTPAECQTIHALLVIMDDDPKIGSGVKKDRKSIQQLLGNIHNDLCEVKTTTLLSSEDNATHEKILNWVQNINAASNDVVFIYYSGHGGMNPDGHTFLFTEGKYLFRSDLVNAIKQVKSPKLSIIITDCCSSLYSTNEQPTLQSSRSITRLTQKHLRNLFLEHTGFLHITAATEKQYGWSNSITGGWFTSNLIKSLDSNPDNNKNSFLSWEEVFENTKQNTEKTFSQATFTTAQLNDMKRKGITSQTPKAYSLPKPLSKSGNEIQKVVKHFEDRKTVNYIFLAIVLCTLFISNRISRSLKKQHVVRRRLSSHKANTLGIVTIEVLLWIGFNIFWIFFRSNWLVICIISIVLIFIVLIRNTIRYA